MRQPSGSLRVPARIAVAGMTLAVVLLGALAVGTAIVGRDGASGLSRAGVQTSGHLRAVQALSVLDTQADALEEGAAPGAVEKLREAERVLDDALARMRSGGVLQATRIADGGSPIVDRMKPALDEFLATRRVQNDRAERAEEELESLFTQLQVLLNDLDADPSGLLKRKLESVSATERTVRLTAYVLIPLGLGGVAACGWILSLYRRRSEAAMLATLATSAEEARTDELTGLPNRRALLEDLERRSEANHPYTLTIADLNGFKRYNDTFGHPAGDALLRRLGRRLAAACDGRGLAFRLGGDEFCVLFPGTTSAEAVHALVGLALSDEGEGFSITAASGVAAVPADARDPTVVLKLADSRMYAAKASAKPSAEDGMSLALTQMLDERHPGLGLHVEEVAHLAAACAEELGLAAEEVRSIRHAAELHDIGKVGVPAGILSKPGPLSDEEWQFMRRHTLIGERILAGVPALERIATFVRSSHERWDGGGYPDRLAGQAIPIGSRIILVADAYCAMTEDRPYARARSHQSALEELRAGSGAQFDPVVLQAFMTALDRRDATEAGERTESMALSR